MELVRHWFIECIFSPWGMRHLRQFERESRAHRVVAEVLCNFACIYVNFPAEDQSFPRTRCLDDSFAYLQVKISFHNFLENISKNNVLPPPVSYFRILQLRSETSPRPENRPDRLPENLVSLMTYHSVTKVSDFFSRNPRGYQWTAFAWGDLEPSNEYVNFFPACQ